MGNLVLRNMAVSKVSGKINPLLEARLNTAKDGETVPITAEIDETAEMVTDRQFVVDCGEALQDTTLTAEQRSILLEARAERHGKLFKMLSEAIAKQQSDLTKALRTFKPQWSYSVARTEKTRAIRKSDGLLQEPCFDIDVTARQVKDVQTRASDILAMVLSKAKGNGKGDKGETKAS